MEVFNRIDDLLLSFFTKISHSWQRLTGLTNYWLAKCALVVMTASSTVVLLNYWRQMLAHETTPVEIITAGLVPILAFHVMIKTSAAEADAQNGESRTKPEIAMVSEIFVRMFWLSLTLLSVMFLPIQLMHTKSIVLEVIRECFCPALCCFFYFIAVDPLPPCTGKVREWIKSLRPTPALEPAKIPVKR